jgi:hypothetical protein
MVPPVTHPWTSDAWHWLVPKAPVVEKCAATVPLSEWKQSGEYEHLDECEDAKSKSASDTREILGSIRKAFPEKPSKQDEFEDQQEIECAALAECIATDDPRLKGK